MAQVRYIVLDVDDSVEFYTQKLGFVLKQQYGPAMAIVTHGDLDLWLAGPTASASKTMPNGDIPAPGGWGRFVLPVEGIDSLVDQLKSEGVVFRNEVITGPGGKQVLCRDPSGNTIELFERA